MPGPSPDANLAEVLSRWTDAFGWADRAAFLCGDDVYTHGEVHRGVREGMRVAVALPVSMELVWAFLGVVRAGAIALLGDPDASALPPADLAVCSPGRHPRTLAPAELIAAMPRARPADACPVLPETPAYGQYAEIYTHGDPEQDYLAMEPFGLRQNDVLFSVPKTYDPIGLRNTVFLPLFSGACAVLDSGRRSVPVVAEGVRRHRVSVLLSTPAFFSRLAAEGPGGTFEPLRMAVSHGAAPPPGRAEHRLGCPVVTP
jgi:fatty acid CoA ligase FadD22